MFKIKSAEIIISAVDMKLMPQTGLSEVALVGRSNVGKSSLVNALLGRKKLARVSAQPGKTRLLNFYLINEQFYLVDVPGYGYAKFSQNERDALQMRMATYFKQRHQLKLVIQLVDFRHPPSSLDIELHHFLKTYCQIRVVATKVDKIPRSQREVHKKIICETLGIENSSLIVVSSEEKTGMEEIWATIEGALIQDLDEATEIEN
ncbi:MAG: ribosome biogenesis GTP-binding protein YihA/YsxC [bacterium]|nr:ribosome biogenesis GTP-binding protein YihA/YsxC [bacterium]